MDPFMYNIPSPPSFFPRCPTKGALSQVLLCFPCPPPSFSRPLLELCAVHSTEPPRCQWHKLICAVCPTCDGPHAAQGHMHLFHVFLRGPNIQRHIIQSCRLSRHLQRGISTRGKLSLFMPVPGWKRLVSERHEKWDHKSPVLEINNLHTSYWCLWQVLYAALVIPTLQTELAN